MILQAKCLLSAKMFRHKRQQTRKVCVCLFKGDSMSHSDFAHPYFGVFFLFIFSIIAFVVVSSLSRIVGNRLARKSEEKLKLAQYECGPLPNKQSNRIGAR